MKGLSKQSAWSADEVARFFADFRAPLRVAAQRDSGFPILCSLWFNHRDDRLFCATQRDAKIVEALERSPGCAFELAPNEPPYFGVRGRGTAHITGEGAQTELESLVDRYLGNRDSELASWLLGRADQEVVIVIEPAWLTSWDYRDRMSG